MSSYLFDCLDNVIDEYNCAEKRIMELQDALNTQQSEHKRLHASLLERIKEFEKRVGIPYIRVKDNTAVYLDKDADGKDKLVITSPDFAVAKLRMREIFYRRFVEIHGGDFKDVESAALKSYYKYLDRFFAQCKTDTKKNLEAPKAKEQPTPKR